MFFNALSIKHKIFPIFKFRNCRFIFFFYSSIDGGSPSFFFNIPVSSGSYCDFDLEEKGQPPEITEKERLRRLFKGEIDLFLMRL